MNDIEANKLAATDAILKDITIASLRGKAQKDFYNFWVAEKKNMPAPHISAIDPLLMPLQCLPHISLISIETDPLRFYVNLTGETLIEKSGQRSDGKYLDEILHTAATSYRYEWCMQNCKPYLYSGPLVWAPKNHKNYFALVMPFINDEGAVSKLVNIVDFS
jgi:hypothetical protein